MLPWKTIINIDASLNRAIYLQISDALIKEISNGRLQPGYKLPGTRTLADHLNLNRKTIINAYEELIALGWLVNKNSSGTYVSDKLPITKFKALDHDAKARPNPNQVTSKPLDFVETHKAVNASIVFNGGSPDPRLAPLDWIYKAMKSLSKRSSMKSIFEYADPSGDPIFKSTLTNYLSTTRGLNLSSDQLLITRGSQMGIYLVTQVLINQGDCVVVGDSSYDAADWAITHAGGEISRIPIELDGMNIDALEALCKKVSVRLVYVTPHHHFPTTVTLSSKKRIQLLNLSYTYGFTILEDDYDFDFHYSSSPILPLASLNPHGNVVYIGSFSKILAPTIRVGYLVGSGNLIKACTKLRRIIDRQGDHVVQRVMHEAITTGELDRHLKKSLIIYRKRRDHMTTMLRKELADKVTFNVPKGGMAIWITFLSDSLLEVKKRLLKHGLSMDIDPELSQKFNAVRIGFASVNEKEIEKGIAILKVALKPPAS